MAPAGWGLVDSLAPPGHPGRLSRGQNFLIGLHKWLCPKSLQRLRKDIAAILVLACGDPAPPSRRLATWPRVAAACIGAAGAAAFRVSDAAVGGVGSGRALGAELWRGVELSRRRQG